MATDREFQEVLRRLLDLEAKTDRLEIAMAKASGMQSLLPYIALVVTGLTGLGIALAR